MESQAEASASGWPLGLPPVTFQMRLADACMAGAEQAASFVLTATPSFSSLSSSDLDTESTISFFPDKSITLGSLIGVGGAADLLGSGSPKASGLERVTEHDGGNESSISTAKLWRFIRCGTCRGFYSDDASSLDEPPSLAYLLELEREAERCGNNAKVYINVMYEDAEEFGTPAINPLFDAAGSSMSSNAAVSLHTVEEEILESSTTKPIKTPDPKRPEAILNNEGWPEGCIIGRRRIKHKRTQSDGPCILTCVSHVWGLPRMTSSKQHVREKSRKKKKNASPKMVNSVISSMGVLAKAEKMSRVKSMETSLSSTMEEKLSIRQQTGIIPCSNGIMSTETGWSPKGNMDLESTHSAIDTTTGESCQGEEEGQLSSLVRGGNLPKEGKLGQKEVGSALSFLRTEILSSKRNRLAQKKVADHAEEQGGIKAF